MNFFFLQYCFCFMFWCFDCKAHGVLAPQPGSKPTPPILEGEILTTRPRGSPQRIFKWQNRNVVKHVKQPFLQYCFCFMFWCFGCKAHGVLAPQPGSEVLTTRPRGSPQRIFKWQNRNVVKHLKQPFFQTKNDNSTMTMIYKINKK